MSESGRDVTARYVSEELRAVLRQSAVYAGFPSAWNALATMTAALERSRGSDRQRES